MKSRFIGLLTLVVLFSFAGKTQDVGKVIIKNAKESFPKFIVSLNGVRINNEYTHELSYDFLDEYQYKINILQAGSKNSLTFMVYSQPNYVSTYVIDRDNYGNFIFGMEKKVLANDTASAKTKSVTPTPSVAVAAASTGTLIEEDEYFDIIKTLKKEPNEKNRLEMAKTFFGSKWLLSSMVKDALKSFNIEVNKVAFAKFAYGRTLDKQNYYKVFDAFANSNSKKEMNEFIKMNP